MTSLADFKWLDLGEAAEAMGIRPQDVRTLVKENKLAVIKLCPTDKAQIAYDFLIENENGQLIPLPTLQGTLTLLRDSGFSNDEAVSWLLLPNDLFDVSPVEALRQGRAHEVRRIAQGLAF